MTPGPFNYLPRAPTGCNYGAILGIRSKLYALYTQARETAQFNLEDIFEKYPTPTGATTSLAFHELYISNVDKDPDFFTRNIALVNVLQPTYERLDLAKRFGLDRLKALDENWTGQLHSTSSFEVNSCAYRGNDVFVGCQWYAFEVREAGENFKVVWVDYGYADLKDSSQAVEFRSDYPLVDGKIICDRRAFRS